MDEIPLTEEMLRDLTSAKSLAKGRSYYHSGAVINPVRRGNRLEALCEGTQYQPYRVWVTLGESGVMDASCTCPYAWEGYCKHIIALLLQYIHQPDSFMERDTVEAILADRSKEELIALVGQMVEKYPDLQALIDRPIPGTQSTVPFKIESYRQELRRAFDHYSGSWGDTIAVDTIYAVIRSAKDFAEYGNWQSAAEIYCAILEESFDDDAYLLDQEGEFLMALDEVIAELNRCLDEGKLAENDTQRKLILKHMLDVYTWNIDYGGMDFATDVPQLALRYARADDIPAIRVQIQDAKAEHAAQAYSGWGLKIYEEFLMQLDAIDNVDPEVTLQRLREQELYPLVFEKLLAMGRVEEAIQTVEAHLTTPYERRTALPRLAEAGQDEAAIRLAREMLDVEYTWHIMDWLLAYYEKENDREMVFRSQLERMRKAPAIHHYTELRAAAMALDDSEEKWAETRTGIYQFLENGKHYNILTKVCLADEQWEAAWENLAIYRETLSATEGAYEYHELALEVAERSRFALPDCAVTVYVDQAQRYIALRTRDDYATAAEYLAVARELYLDHLQDKETWEELIEEIKTENRRLPALQDELRKAGL